MIDTGRGGSDSHHGLPVLPETASKNTPQREYNYVGTPTTWVFAKEKTAQAVVDALTNGRVSVSSNPYAPRVVFYADVNTDGKTDMMMGDNVKATGNPVRFRVQLYNKKNEDSAYTVKVVKNGNPYMTLKISGKDSLAEFVDSPTKSGRTYYRVTVEGPQTSYPEVPNSVQLSGSMIALSNPIYFNFDPDF